MKNIVKWLIAGIAIIGFAGVAFALPYYQQTAGLVPATNDTFYIGTSSPGTLEYKAIFTKDITISGTCTGCGGSGSVYPFPNQLGGGNATSSLTGFSGGILDTASSTFASTTINSQLTTTGNSYLQSIYSNLSIGGIAVDGHGLFYSSATTTAGTGLTYTSNSFNVNTTQNITNLSNLSTNALVITSGGNGTLGAYAGTTCTNQAITVLSVLGAATCSSITDSFFSGQLGLSHGGTNASLSGASQLIAMNSGNTALTTGGTGYTLTSSLLTATNASTTALTAGSYFESIGNAGFGTTTPAFTLSVNNSGSDFYVNSSGEIVGRDTTNAWNGRITPTIPLTYNVATSTVTFTGTSTPGVDITPTQTAPFTGLIRGVRCNSNTFLGFILTDNGTATTSYIVASSTVNHILFASALSITAGDKLTAYAGTTTSATVGSGVVYASCTFEATQTP